MPKNSLNLAGFNEDAAENILENRRRFLKLFKGEWLLAGCWQVHGSDVRVVDSGLDAKPAEDARGDTVYCDAIVSDARGVMAGVKTADCVPILNYKTKPEDVVVAIGPAAGACCYEVGSDVIDAFGERSANSVVLFKPTRADHACVDLIKANSAQLVAAGVEEQKIYSAPLCTMCRTDLFFSYRREKNLYGKVARLMSVIGRT